MLILLYFSFSLFYQLQTVFAHLMESQLQYYVPDKFWKCFRMDGQPVNVREQQGKKAEYIYVQLNKNYL